MIQIFQWLIFPTDLLFLGFILFAVLMIYRSRKSEKLASVTFCLLKKPIVMVSSILFLFYLSLAVLDSIHFYHQQKIETVLDQIFSPLNHFYETTYSKPFAKVSYSKKIIYDESAQQAKQIYAPLRYTEHSCPLWKLFSRALAWSLISLVSLYIFFSLLIQKNIRFHYLWQSIQDSGINHKVAKRTLSALFVLCFFIYMVMQQYHILGTDKVGQDVFYQAVKSIRTAFIIGFLTSFILLPFAISLGLMAGYFGKKVDDIIQYLYTVISSVPGVLLIAASILALQIAMNRYENLFPTVIHRAEFKLLMLCAIMGLTSWTSLCRLVRAETLKLKEIDYVAAARVMGSSTYVILFKHILPNLMHIVIIATAIDFSGLVLAETILSYIGIGVDPNLFSWGLMINAARLELAREPIVWWPLLSAFFMMFVLVLSANIIADNLRDALDPKVNS